MTTNDGISQSTSPGAGRERRVFVFKATQLIWLLLGILEAMIALRIGLKLIGANPDSPIVSMIYSFTSMFLFPFYGMISSPTAGNMVLEVYSMFAMLIYALIAWALERIVWLIFYRPREASAVTTHNPEKQE